MSKKRADWKSHPADELLLINALLEDREVKAATIVEHMQVTGQSFEAKYSDGQLSSKLAELKRLNPEAQHLDALKRSLEDTIGKKAKKAQVSKSKASRAEQMVKVQLQNANIDLEEEELSGYDGDLGAGFQPDDDDFLPEEVSLISPSPAKKPKIVEEDLAEARVGRVIPAISNPPSPVLHHRAPAQVAPLPDPEPFENLKYPVYVPRPSVSGPIVGARGGLQGSLQTRPIEWAWTETPARWHLLVWNLPFSASVMVGIDVETVDGPTFTLEVKWNHAPFCDSVMEQNVGRFDNRVRAEEASMDIQWPPGIYKGRPH